MLRSGIRRTAARRRARGARLVRGTRAVRGRWYGRRRDRDHVGTVGPGHVRHPRPRSGWPFTFVGCRSRDAVGRPLRAARRSPAVCRSRARHRRIRRRRRMWGLAGTPTRRVLRGDGERGRVQRQRHHAAGTTAGTGPRPRRRSSARRPSPGSQTARRAHHEQRDAGDDTDRADDRPQRLAGHERAFDHADALEEPHDAHDEQHDRDRAADPAAAPGAGHDTTSARATP